MGVGDQAGHWLEALLADHVASGQDHGAGTVVQARGVAGGDAAVFLEGGAHGGQLFCSDVATYVLIDGEQLLAFAAGHFDRHDLLDETPFGDGTGRALLADQGQLILHLAGDAEFFRDIFRGDTHVHTGERVVQDAEHVVDGLHVTHASAPAGARQQVRATAHGFGTGGDDRTGVAEHQALGGRDDGLQARTAQAVDVEGRGFLGNAGIHGGDAGQVSITGFGRDHVAHHQVADQLRSQGRTFEGGTGHVGGQLRQRHILERATEAADGRAGSADYKNFVVVHIRLRVR
ncbi:hypothetical protein D3C84_219380 [compost metagenome]